MLSKLYATIIQYTTPHHFLFLWVVYHVQSFLLAIFTSSDDGKSIPFDETHNQITQSIYVSTILLLLAGFGISEGGGYSQNEFMIFKTHIGFTDLYPRNKAAQVFFVVNSASSIVLIFIGIVKQ